MRARGGGAEAVHDVGRLRPARGSGRYGGREVRGREHAGRRRGRDHGGALRRRPAALVRALRHQVLRLEELVEHRARVARAVLRVAGRRPQGQVVEQRGDAGVLQRRRRHGVVRVLVRDLHRLLALERLLAGEHLVHHDADRVDVAPGVRDAPGDELGGEVGDRPEQRLPARRVAGGGAREAEVADLDAAVVGQQHVLGLQVAVDDAGLVRGDEPGQHRLEDVHRLLGREAPVLAEEVAQGDALQVLHDEVRRAEVLALVEDVDDVRVGEPGGAARLLDEPVAERGVVGEVGVHHLHGDAALEPQVGGEVDRRHAAAGDARADLVAAVEQPAHHGVGRRGGHVRQCRERSCRSPGTRSVRRASRSAISGRRAPGRAASRAPRAPTCRRRRGRRSAGPRARPRRRS